MGVRTVSLFFLRSSLVASFLFSAQLLCCSLSLLRRFRGPRRKFDSASIVAFAKRCGVSKAQIGWLPRRGESVARRCGQGAAAPCRPSLTLFFSVLCLILPSLVFSSSQLHGTASRPRLAVHKSNQHLTAQVIDDDAMVTLVHVTTMQPEVKALVGSESGLCSVRAARLVGSRIAELCLAKGIDKLAFDRAGYPYHGRVKEIADGAREGGINM